MSTFHFPLSTLLLTPAVFASEEAVVDEKPLTAPEPPPLESLVESEAESETPPAKPTSLKEVTPIPFPKVTSWDFDGETVGNEASEFLTISMTQPSGLWMIFQEPSDSSKGNVLAQLEPLEQKDHVSYQILYPYHNENLKIQFQLKAVSGEQSQGGGIVFRFRDSENHYLIHLNVAERYLSFEKVVNGKRESLMRTEAPLKQKQWHSVEVVINGPRLITFLDGAPYLNQTDGTFFHGRVGFFTEGDAITYFDNLTIEEITT